MPGIFAVLAGGLELGAGVLAALLGVGRGATITEGRFEAGSGLTTC